MPEDAAGRETKNAPPGAGMPQKQPFPRTQSRAFPMPGAFYKPPGAKRRTQYFLLSDLPHRWSYFDYDQGPLSCVHLPVFVNSAAAAPAPGAALAISFFIIAPQKKGVNPKARFCKDFYKVSYRNKTPFSVLRHTEKGVLLGYCLGVRRNHVTWEVVAAPLPMAKV